MKIKIPKNWTPKQAESVADFISDLEFAIRKQYQTKILNYQLTELKREENKTNKNNFNQEDF